MTKVKVRISFLLMKLLSQNNNQIEIGQQNGFEKNLATVETFGNSIGGKKTKKRNKKTKKQKTYRRNVHMRGGVDKDQDKDKEQTFIIISDKKDMYDVSKYNTGAELVIDMDNGLYIEINEFKSV
jgi:predicted RNA-binding protein with PUA domain